MTECGGAFILLMLCGSGAGDCLTSHLWSRSQFVRSAWLMPLVFGNTAGVGDCPDTGVPQELWMIIEEVRSVRLDRSTHNPDRPAVGFVFFQQTEFAGCLVNSIGK